MEHDPKITAKQVLAGRCGISREFRRVDDRTPDGPSPRQLAEASAHRFYQGCDAGVWKRLSNILLEPQNPFDAGERRAPKRDAVVLLVLVAIAAVITLLFNLSAAE